MPPFLYKFALSGVSPLNGFGCSNLICGFPKPVNYTCSIESSGVRRGNVGGYFAKQNAHSGAKPPQWRTGSSKGEALDARTSFGSRASRRNFVPTCDTSAATIVAPFLYKNALSGGMPLNRFVGSNLICGFPKPVNYTCSVKSSGVRRGTVVLG